MQRLLEIMRRLREGCPWDSEQTHLSLRPYLLEEAAEAVDAITQGDPQEMAEELGDVLLQVAFHAVIAEESESFSYETIESAIVEKLIRRHPHVFGEVRADTAEHVLANWQKLKEEEKSRTKAESVPRSLSALMRAYELGRKLDWPKPDLETIRRKLQALETCSPEEAESVFGEVLLSLVDYARGLKINPELALRAAADARAEEAE